MPRIRQYEDKYIKEDLLKEIGARCVWAGIRTNEELGNAVGVTGASIGNYKRDPGKIQLKTMRSMVAALKLDPGVILRFLGYSAQDIKKFARDQIQ